MEEREKENATNENINPHADTLVDLVLADDAADETKGGPLANGGTARFPALFSNKGTTG